MERAGTAQGAVLEAGGGVCSCCSTELFLMCFLSLSFGFPGKF